MIQASAPGKLLLFGDHSAVYGEPCIVTAVNERVFVNIKKNGTDVFQLSAPDLGLEAYSKTTEDLGQKELPKSVAFVEMCYKRFLDKYPQKEGVVVSTKSEFSAQFGFGSSSAVTVAFARALTTLYNLKVSKKELFDLCYQAVLDVQGLGSGFDIAAAIWGGTIYYVKPAAEVRSIYEKQLPLVVGYTGIKADTPTLVRMVQKMKEDNPKKIKDIFLNITRIVKNSESLFATENWDELGEMMNQNQDLLRKLNVSSRELEASISASLKAGAFGAKLSGAGVGDCMVALTLDRGKIEPAIANAGGLVMNVETGAEGVRLEGLGK